MRVIYACLALAVIAGCASTATPTTAQVAAAPMATASAPEQVCRKERPTGSLMMVTVCEPVVSDAERQREVNEMRNTIRMQNQPKAAGGPG
jgi:hypothetical protein